MTENYCMLFISSEYYLHFVTKDGTVVRELVHELKHMYSDRTRKVT